MRMLFLVSAMLCGISCFAQKRKILTDTSNAPGFIKENDTYLCRFAKGTCHCITGRVLDKGEPLVISGARTCNEEYYNGELYFEVLYDTCEYLIDARKVVTDTTYIRQLLLMSDERKSAFKMHAKQVMAALQYAKVDKVVKFLDNAKKQGLYIDNWSIYDVSEYTQGTGVKFEISNKSNRTIKYIWFTMVGLNPVGDPVKAKSGLSSASVKGVGPIEPEQSGTYSFDYTWFTDLVEDAKITSVKIQYMDNTTKLITNPRTIIITDEHRRTLSGSNAW